jgi:MFS superfamily sulfate permease-like transporter
MKNNYLISPRQELLSMGSANLASAFASGYVVSGGLSQSTVNEKSGARTPLSLIICSGTLALILLYLTSLLENLPEVILAVIVLHAVSGLIKIKELKRIWQLSRDEFGIAMIAILGVLFLGILRGVLISVILSLILLIRRMTSPSVSLLGRVGKTSIFTDAARHPDNQIYPGMMVLRIESSILYFNAGNILDKILARLKQSPTETRLLIIDLSASNHVDVAGSKMLLELARQLEAKNISLKIVDALSNVREILRRQGMEEITGHISRKMGIDDYASAFEKETH